MAQAGAEGGVAPIDDPEVDQPHFCGPAVVYDAPVELKWSSVRNCPAGLKERSTKYTMKYERVRTLAQAEDHLRRRHVLTWAGDWGGSMSGQVRGSKYPILYMARRESWNHQESCWGTWSPHPELGRLWWIQNQWWNPGTTKYTMRGRQIWTITAAGVAIPVHGIQPVIPGFVPFPEGGYWIDDSSMDYQCRTGEVVALILFDGFTGREIGLGNV